MQQCFVASPLLATTCLMLRKSSPCEQWSGGRPSHGAAFDRAINVAELAFVLTDSALRNAVDGRRASGRSGKRLVPKFVTLFACELLTLLPRRGSSSEPSMACSSPGGTTSAHTIDHAIDDTAKLRAGSASGCGPVARAAVPVAASRREPLGGETQRDIRLWSRPPGVTSSGHACWAALVLLVAGGGALF